VIRTVLKNFRGKKVGVIGDFMIDEYIKGNVERISPEAPVPVVEAKNSTYSPGGAGNVVANLISLGAEVVVFGVVGTDKNGAKLKELLEKLGANVEFLVEDDSRPTTIKTRIIAGSQQLLRIDWESREEVKGEVAEKIYSALEDTAEDFDALVISDYGKGVVIDRLFEITKKLKEKLPVLLDPKEKNYPIYRHVTTMTPNIKETFQAVGIKPESDELAKIAGEELIRKFKLDFAVITRSEQGLSVVGKDFIHHIPARAKQVFDVTGAGDTVISVMALALASGASPEEAGYLANIAGGIVVGKLGTAVVSVEEIERELDEV